MKISAFLPVYNEEKRIDDTITSLLWCDEIILLDKFSTDQTVIKAKKFGEKVKVFFMENTPGYNSKEWEYLLNYCSNEWVIRFTASDLIDPQLANHILSLIKDTKFDKDIINVPFKRYVLGIESKRSPWFSVTAPMVFRKSVLSIDLDDVHASLRFEGETHTVNLSNHYMYHLTHVTVDVMMDRHIRYWRGEANGGKKNDLSQSFKKVMWEVLKLIFYKKTYLLGKKGVMLCFAYITYHMMSYVYKWEKNYSEAPEVYDKIRLMIAKEWEGRKY